MSDKEYTDIGRNWQKLIDMAHNLGYEIGDVEFVQIGSDNRVRMPFEQMQTIMGARVLKAALLAARITNKFK